MASPKKPMRLALMIPLDIALFAVCILSFSYFHHVRPQTLENDPNKLLQASIPTTNPYGTQTTPISGTTATRLTPPEITTLPTTSDAEVTTSNTMDGTTASTDQTGITVDTSVSTPQQSESTPQTPQSNGSGSPPTTPPITSTTTTTTVLEYDLSGWGYKFYDRFSLGNDIEITENSYRSHDIAFTIETRNVGNSVAYIADIYIRYIDNFQSAFAKDEYGKNIVERPESIAARHNAVLAVNGDYYGIRDTGVIVRNYTLYRDTPKGELCGIYYDGTVVNYFKDSFDLNAAMANGLYQTMTFGPYLIMDGNVRTNIVSAVTETNPRTGFGYYEPGHYCFVVVDGRQSGYSEGMTLDEYAQLFADLGCPNAYNLDGGQSSMMLFDDRVYNQPYKGGRSTSDIFFLAERN